MASCSGPAGLIEGLTIASFSVLPSRLRHWVNALWSSTVQVPRDGPTVHARMLTAIAGACRDHQQLRLDYRDHGGSDSIRTVKPHRLVCWGRRWCLLAWDTDRQDWRTFRVDRLKPAHRPARGSPPATCPTATSPPTSRGACGPREAVSGPDDHTHRPRRSPSRYRPQWGCWKRWMSARACWTPAPTPSTRSLSTWDVGVDFEVSEPPDLVDYIRKLADRYRHATR